MKLTAGLLLLSVVLGCASAPEVPSPSPAFAAGIGALIRDRDGIEIVTVATVTPASVPP